MKIEEMDAVIQKHCTEQDDYNCGCCAIQHLCEPIGGVFTHEKNVEACKEAYEIIMSLRGSAHDSVNHPSHYNKGTIEVWDFISDWKLNFDRGNAIKYICRAGSKDPNKEIQDLEKAIEYINHEIKMLKGETENGTEKEN